MRSGVIAQKVGMTRVFTEAGRAHPRHRAEAGECPGAGAPHRREERLHRAAARRRHAASRAASRAPSGGSFAVAKVEPKRKLAEFRVSPDNLIEVGAEITADHFVKGQHVDVTGTNQGKGFQGAMKRWNFGGLRATHGVSVTHRSHGSTGQRQDPGKVFKGKKMAGHMGDDARHHAEPGGGRDRQGARPGAGARRGARHQGRLGAGARCRQAAAAQGCAQARLVPQGRSAAARPPRPRRRDKRSKRHEGRRQDARCREAPARWSSATPSSGSSRAGT